jgi:predicted lysophospholipase L1 biosynthesis ABC-type transport system permease subunit
MDRFEKLKSKNHSYLNVKRSTKSENMGLTQRINALSKSNTFLAGDFVINEKKETPKSIKSFKSELPSNAKGLKFMPQSPAKSTIDLIV